MSNADDWSQQWGAFFKTATLITETWLTQTVDTTLDAADAIAQAVEQQVGPTLEDWAGQVHEVLDPLEQAIDAEAERLTDEIAHAIGPVVTPMVDGIETWLDTVSRPINQTVDPWLNEHFTCIGCRHYHGQAHGGHMLVCAMYPYGPETEKCPDWQGTWTSPPGP